MTGDQTAQMLYLGLLIIAIGGSYLVANRRSLGRSLQHGAIWGLIFLGVIAAVGLWGDIRATTLTQTRQVDAGVIRVERSNDSHFYLNLDVNDTVVRFLVDTGATDIVLTAADARRVGLDPAALVYLGRAQTANGEVRTARVSLDQVTLGDITDKNVSALVNDSEMQQSLLGLTYLNRFAKIEMTADHLTLSR